MEFKGTIIITDPCYFAKDEDWDSGLFDYDNYNISVPGFTNYIWTTTGMGDVSGGVYQLNDYVSQSDLEGFIEELVETTKEFIAKPTSSLVESRLSVLHRQYKDLGKYCVDSGTFGVFYLDEVLNYNPSFLSDHGNWCYTIIKDFVGNIDTYIPEELKYLVGTGNKTIFTKC